MQHKKIEQLKKIIFPIIMLCPAFVQVMYAQDKRNSVQYEPTEWTNVWMPSATKNDLPRVLLIGNSITQSYYSFVEEPKKRYIMDMVYNNPGQSPQASKFNNPEYLKALGFSSMVPHWYVQCSITYDLL
jgi:hypothetical protein